MKLEKFSSRKAAVKRPLWNSQEVAQHLDLSVKELHLRLEKNGGPKPVYQDGKVKRFDISEVMKWWKLAQHEQPTAYKTAVARGDKFYTTGKPCAAGHLAPRYTSDKSCIECAAAKYQAAAAKGNAA